MTISGSFGRALCAIAFVLSSCASLSELSEPLRQATDCVADNLRATPDVTNVAVFPPRVLSNGGRSVIVSYDYAPLPRPVRYELYDSDEGTIRGAAGRDSYDVETKVATLCHIEFIHIISSQPF